MPTPSKGPRLGGSPAHERLMLANLATALFEHKRITTTVTRAKRLQPVAEKLITLAKRGDLHARRKVMTTIRRKDVVAELFEATAPQFAERNGGYTRVTQVGNRKGDNAPMAVIELVLEPVSAKQATVREAEKAAQRAAAPAQPAEEPTVEETTAPDADQVAETTAEAVETEAPEESGATADVQGTETEQAQQAAAESSAQAADAAALDAQAKSSEGPQDRRA